MKMPKHSLRKVVTFLNNPDEDGGFWLPNIQRKFVWSEDQICRLFDSVLREYPISTLLIWKTNSEVLCREFVKNYQASQSLSGTIVPLNDHKKCLVLDGQQRLQSLFIGLRGSYEGRELYLDILSGDAALPEDVKYRFKFLPPDSEQRTFPMVKFKDLVFYQGGYFDAAENLINSAKTKVVVDDCEKVRRNVATVFQAFHGDDGIAYQEIDSIENQGRYTDDDVVEIFIRANSGGTKLGKSDLLFSLLSASWDHAGESMETLLSEINQHGFAFERDFVLKTCLTLLDKGARYEVGKFRAPGVRDNIEQEWDRIAAAIRDVVDFVRGKTFIRSGKALLSALVLIPLIYSRYHFQQRWKEAQNVDSYVLLTLISGAFSGHPDQLIDRCVARIRQDECFNAEGILGVITSQRGRLVLSEERLWEISYGDGMLHLLFNLWYKDFDYNPAYANNLPEVDHIFPQSALAAIKVTNPETGRPRVRYTKNVRDQMANCMLLTKGENGAGGKSDTLPEDWFSDKSDEYLDMHLIPKDRALWNIDRFEDFIEARKALIKEKFSYLLIQQGER